VLKKKQGVSLLGGESLLNSIEFQMSLLMFVALAGYFLAYRINQSVVVGIILMGILIGPSALNLVTYTDFVATLAHLGAIVLLFTIGLEFNIKDIWRVRYMIIALVGVIVPAFAGYFLAVAFDYDFKASIFIGTALTATSIAITANVLKEMGKLQTDAAQAIIAAAVVDDVLGLLALSTSEGLVSGNLTWSSILITLVKAVAFIVIGIILGRTFFRRLLMRLDNTRMSARFPESIFLFTIMVAFLYAMAANYVKLSAIVGAFMAGSSFAGIKLARGAAAFREGAEHLQIVFASIFFVSLGVIMDLRNVDLTLLWFVLALTAVAIATKIIGCGLPAYFHRMSVRDSLIVGVGMVPRGEVAMIVALIGLNTVDKATGLSLISQEVYAAVILMALLTTIIPPLIMRNWLFKTKPAPQKDAIST
jgi:Kef-type K+ transport system membrane component KefB